MHTIQLTLEAAMVLLAAARAAEQFATLRNALAANSKQNRQLPAVSLLAPVASAAAVAYGHFFGSDPALLVAAWVNTVAGSFCWTLRQLVSRGKADPGCPAAEVAGDRL